MTRTDTAPDRVPTAAAELSTLDRLLPIWIGSAMVVGLALGRMLPHLDEWLDAIKIDTVSVPIAIGLLAMMYPVLAKVRYRRIGDQLADRRTLVLSSVMNWVVGPALMFALAWLFLGDLPELRTGLIIVGLARCIAMVLIWNDLACGNRELGAVLVAVNSVFQIVMYSVLGWFYLTALPDWLGLDTAQLDVSMWQIGRSVLVFLGVPLLAGFLTRAIGEKRKGTEWYEERFLPRIGPIALYGLLFTIVVLFALQGEQITDRPLDVARVAIPLLVYFAVMWFGSFTAGYRLGLPYDRNTSVAFTAAGNNFELAIAVAIAVFGVTSGQALAGTIGPLIEVPALVGLVYVALWARRRFYPASDSPAEATAAAGDDVAGADVPTVLFLCVHNAGRSQMALGWFDQLARGRAAATSGGSEPADAVNPVAVAAMAEVGIDIAGSAPRRWTAELVGAADVVVTMGCGDSCPVFPGTRYEDWAVEDPAGQGLAAVRPIRDDLERRVRDLLVRLDVPVAATSDGAGSSSGHVQPVVGPVG